MQAPPTFCTYVRTYTDHVRTYESIVLAYMWMYNTKLEILLLLKEEIADYQ